MDRIRVLVSGDCLAWSGYMKLIEASHLPLEPNNVTEAEWIAQNGREKVMLKEYAKYHLGTFHPSAGVDGISLRITRQQSEKRRHQ